MKVQSTFYPDFISTTDDIVLIKSITYNQKMPKLLILDAFTLSICVKNVANYALIRCKIFSLKIRRCQILDKYHIWPNHFIWLKVNLKMKYISILTPFDWLSSWNWHEDLEILKSTWKSDLLCLQDLDCEQIFLWLER